MTTKVMGNHDDKCLILTYSGLDLLESLILLNRFEHAPEILLSYGFVHLLQETKTC